ncbi:MAG: HAD-IC family P-type ATPase, partial [Rikenellaceae bacterium]|nr:HAD-IC family P-type ATPase [Rikenellaceae bacterium]
MSRKNFWNLPIEEIERQFNTSAAEGLASVEASRRLTEYGRNAFEKKRKRSLFQKFSDQFKSFMILVLLAAAVISGIVGQLNGEGFTDAIIILVIVLLNAVIGTAQEAKAEQSLEALEKLSAPHCKVVRGGQIETIDSADLVPGDVVVLDTGDSVPADLRLTEAVNLKIQESALTGESLPEDKHTAPIEGDAPLGDRENLAFSSCNVTYGRGRGIVIATAMQTEVGKIAAMIQSVPDTKTPMQEKLDRLGKFLGLAALAVCALIFIVGILYRHNVLDMFMTAVSLAAAAIPEGLPAVSTIVLAVGVQRLVRKNAIVRTLPSVETLGSTSVICSDKTGTLTQNRMTVVKLYTNGKFINATEGTSDEPQQETLLSVLVLANDAKLSGAPGAWKTTGDPTETALINAGLRFNLVKNALEGLAPRQAEIPFDSERKMMTTIHRRQDGSLVAYTKGGLDETLACCDRILLHDEVKPLTDETREKLRTANRQLAQGALRVLAAALKPIDVLPAEIVPATVERELVFVGLAGMID